MRFLQACFLVFSEYLLFYCATFFEPSLVFLQFFRRNKITGSVVNLSKRVFAYALLAERRRLKSNLTEIFASIKSFGFDLRNIFANHYFFQGFIVTECLLANRSNLILHSIDCNRLGNDYLFLRFITAAGIFNRRSFFEADVTIYLFPFFSISTLLARSFGSHLPAAVLTARMPELASMRMMVPVSQEFPVLS